MRGLAIFIVVSVAVVRAPAAACADVLRVALRNDVFTGLVPPMDDDGFTHDFDVRFWRPRGAYLIGAQLATRWITEAAPIAFEGRRRDQLDLLATLERSWGTAPTRAITTGVRIGPTFTGNLGGRRVQNGWHTLCGCGVRLDQGLPPLYDGDAAAGALLGARAGGRAGEPIAQAYGFLDGQLAVGTGVSAIEGAAGGRFVGHVGRTQLAAHLELAVMRFHLVDERLGLTGAYRPGWQAAWRLGVHVAWSRYRLEYEYRANESGSGEPVGVVAVTFI